REGERGTSVIRGVAIVHLTLQALAPYFPKANLQIVMGMGIHLQQFTSIPPLRSSSSRPKLVAVRFSLPFAPHEAKYHRELQAAVDVVTTACRICVNVQKSLFSQDGRVMEKTDNTPVTVADFGVQALVSLELSQLFPTIPLVAEEDSAFLRLSNLVDVVTTVVNDNISGTQKQLTEAELLKAVDRGGKNSYAFGSNPATYWVLDPIDGTRGFLKGQNAFPSLSPVQVGLALVVEGEVVLGVMGCPNWQENFFKMNNANGTEFQRKSSTSGVVMASHVGCGTWTISLSHMLDEETIIQSSWIRRLVDQEDLVHKARFCIPESQTWDSLPLSPALTATSNTDNVGDDQILLLHACCGSLCKYLMVALGTASVFLQRVRTERTIRAWDHVSGMICVEEAGGKVTDWKGSQLNFSADEMERRTIFPEGGLIVSNGNLHNQILKLVSSSSSIM
ncbi:hypothetical protein V2J09_006330, partial [Rumex salicifolius]